MFERRRSSSGLSRTGFRLQSPTKGSAVSTSLPPKLSKTCTGATTGILIKRGIRNQSLFEAYVEYCFAPKHTVGEQLLDVRRDKRERAAFAAATGNGAGGNEEEE